MSYNPAMSHVPDPVREAFESFAAAVSMEVAGRSHWYGARRSDTEPDFTDISDHIAASGWAGWLELVETVPIAQSIPGELLERLTARRGEQVRRGAHDRVPARDPRMIPWLASTLDAWIGDQGYRVLLRCLAPAELQELLGARDLQQLESLAATSRLALSGIALALASDPDDRLPALPWFARRVWRGDIDALVEHGAEISELVRQAAALDLSDEDRFGWQGLLAELVHRKSSLESNVETASALDRLLSDEKAIEIIRTLDGHSLARLAADSTALFRALASKAARNVAMRIALYWSTQDGRRPNRMWNIDLERVLNAAPPALREHLAPLVGHDVVAARTEEPTAQSIDQWLATNAPMQAEPLKEMWQLILLWEGCRDHVAQMGYEERLWAHATKHAELWSRSLPALLAGTDRIPLVLALTIELVAQHPEIQEVLRELASIEHSDTTARAGTILQLLEGTEGKLEASYQAITSFVARRADEKSSFPHPLELSSTWVGSNGLEQTLRGLVHTACDRFSRRAKDQLGLEEEVITRDLLRDLERALEDFPLTPWALREDMRHRSSKIDIEYRQESKHAEKRTGVDVALLVEIDVANAVRITTAEIIQVKKAERDDGGFRDKWKIDVPQLRILLNGSATAVYLLIGPRGEVHVVPAKFLFAILQGRGQENLDKATVNYTQIRGAAIPLKQFLTDLLLGLWIGGTGRPVKIARGKNPNIVPMNLLKIQVRVRPVSDEQLQ